MRRVRIHDEAAREFEEAAAWYERERPGLGLDFAEAVEAALDLLQEEFVPAVAMPGPAGLRESSGCCSVAFRSVSSCS